MIDMDAGPARDGLLRLWRCQRGTPAVEFALMAPPLVLILLGIVEVALVTAGHVLIEGAIRQASRYGITGYVPAGTTRINYLKQIVGKDTAGLIDAEQLTITYQIYSSFANVHQPEPYVDQNGNAKHDAGEPFTDINGNAQWDADMGAAGLGGPGDIVAYTISYDWPVITDLLKPLLGDDNGLIRLTARVVVRNEPF